MKYEIIPLNVRIPSYIVEATHWHMVEGIIIFYKDGEKTGDAVPADKVIVTPEK